MAAEMVTGVLVSTFLGRTIDTLASRLFDIFHQKKHKKQLRNLKMKLLAIDVVAFDAEQKQFTDSCVRDWLLRAKDVVIDAEDLLDELDYELSKSQVEAESQSAAKKVWSSLNSSFLIENEIESRMAQVIEDLDDLADESNILGLKKGGGVEVGSGSSSKLTYSSLPNESDICGRDDDKESIFKWLTSDTHNNLSILSIVGMGGLGKTSLAQHVFNDPRLEGKFDINVWVSVPQEFDVLKVSRAILDTIASSTDHSIPKEVIQKRLKENLMGKKFLLVLDDVWNENSSKWEDVQKPLVFGGQGSRILVTARGEKVADSMRSEKYRLEVLKEDYCWELFAKHAFQGANPQQDPDFVEIAKKIVKKCDGLPLALKTMGSLLHNKSFLWEWENIMRSDIWDLSENESGILPALKLSYLHLPSHLKKCFAFCALLPKGYQFDKDILIQWWMAQNFLESHVQIKSPIEVGEQYFNDLLSWSFFQQSSNQDEERFIMHDLLNDLAKYVCKDVCIRIGVDEPEGISKTTRHCSFLSSELYFDGFGSSIDTQKLHTFTRTDPNSGWIWYCKMSIDDLFSRFKLIRILSLNHYLNLTEVPESIGNLKHLRSLDLSCTNIEELPDSMSLLYKLQILKLNKCRRLKQFPSCLHKLQNLRCLELVGIGVENVAAHLGKLKNVQVSMSSFHVEKSKEMNIQRLGQFNLYGSLTIDDLQNIENPSDALEADLKSKPHLMGLHLEWNFIGSSSVDSTKAEDIIENLRPSKYLKKLSIRNYIGKQFPNWLLHNSLPNLVSLVLDDCRSCERLPPLGLLPFLKELRIYRLDGIVSIDADFHGNNSSSFKSLQTLWFSDMRQWEKWDCQDVTGAFPRLEDFWIKNCPKLKAYLPKFVALKYLYVSNCEQLEALIVSAIELLLQDCGKLQLDCSTMEKLTMDGHDMAASSVAMVGHMLFNTSLEDLSICSTLETISDDCVSLRIFPLDFFPTLKRLELSGFPNLQMISQDHVHNHLQDLTIEKCPKFESLPANMHMLLPSLVGLHIEDCPTLESFPDGGLPSNLNYIRLGNCFRLVGLLKGALGDSSSLESLGISTPDAECFLDGGLLPTSLTELQFLECQNLEKLDYKGLLQLSSLRRLYLLDCPNLQRLPEEGLPKSISSLHIIDCPLLKQRCQEGGEDWEKVAHIRNLYICSRKNLYKIELLK
ncbi:putative disease resistance RPP13-like protein 1 [Vigna unguiculata]|uniref:NB-LRR receptor n=1 Tax=Vigna unguiculata TaxID=3917 RepID=M9T814_VIGUN|nr:putative disease resistance RPP13-like protein 1 [Vigna unguiculata]AGI99538.1 NB-LRR receptor [Vigna unguiculata]